MTLRVYIKCMNHFLVFVLFLAYVQSECNVCSPNSGLTCVSSNQFQVCINGTPTGNINTCPSGTVCSSVGNFICREPGPNTIKGCEDCNRCDVTNTFACTGPSTYVLCLGTTKPSKLAGSCETKYVCNRNNRHICEDSTNGGVATCTEAIIPKDTTTTTSPAPGLDVSSFCKAKKQYGRYAVAVDPTCRQYFHCFSDIGGKWDGWLMTCPDRTYFEKSIALCDVGIPENC